MMSHQTVNDIDRLRVASVWMLRSSPLALGGVLRLMGIVNATPDSFSDGGTCVDPHRAVDHALSLIEAGADLIDVGGESTRPYAAPVAADEEQRRVVPIIRELRRQSAIPISIDTSKAVVAQAALDEGVDIINDVTGLTGDPAMIAVALETGAAVCAMHMQGTPQTMQVQPRYQDVVAEIREFLRGRLVALQQAGIERARICLDPGIGFGKNHAHNLALLAACHRFHELGQPLLIGHSRKGFIGKLMNSNDLGDRDAGTAALAVYLARQRVQILRVHNVGLVRKTLDLMRALPADPRDG
jgi:dihydropteroate synthase